MWSRPFALHATSAAAAPPPSRLAPDTGICTSSCTKFSVQLYHTEYVVSIENNFRRTDLANKCPPCVGTTLVPALRLWGGSEFFPHAAEKMRWVALRRGLGSCQWPMEHGPRSVSDGARLMMTDGVCQVERMAVNRRQLGIDMVMRTALRSSAVGARVARHGGRDDMAAAAWRRAGFEHVLQGLQLGSEGAAEECPKDG